MQFQLSHPSSFHRCTYSTKYRKQDERRISVYRQKRYFLTVQNAHFELPFFVVETEIAIDIPESAVYYEDVEIFSLCYPTMNDRIAISVSISSNNHI